MSIPIVDKQIAQTTRTTKNQNQFTGPVAPKKIKLRNVIMTETSTE